MINLTSRRPTAEPIRELLLNRTTLGGTDVVLFTGGLAGSRQTEADAGWGYTLLERLAWAGPGRPG